MKTITWKTKLHEVEVQMEEETVTLEVDGRNIANFESSVLFDAVVDTMAESTSSAPGMARRRLEAQLLKMIRNYGQVIFG